MVSAFAFATPALAIVPMPERATSFTLTLGLRVDLLQVIDELRQIFDGIDVVMGRRRDQRDAGCRMAELGDLHRHLEAGELATFAGLRTLCDLDLDLAAIG